MENKPSKPAAIPEPADNRSKAEQELLAAIANAKKQAS